MYVLSVLVVCNPHAKRLYDDLLNNYNLLIRPVSNNTEKLTVRLGLKLSQLIDVVIKKINSPIYTFFNWIDSKIDYVILGLKKSNNDHKCLGCSGNLNFSIIICHCKGQGMIIILRIFQFKVINRKVNLATREGIGVINLSIEIR